MFHGFRDVLADLDLTEATIGLERNFFDAALHEVFSADILPRATVVSATPVLSRLRMLKDNHEIDLLRHAVQVADVGMDAAVRTVGDGILERLVAAEAEYAMRHAGADGWAAPTYVAVRLAVGDGARSGVLPADRLRGRRADPCRSHRRGLHRRPVPNSVRP